MISRIKLPFFVLVFCELSFAVDFTYSIQSGQVTVTGCQGACESTLVIPDEISNLPVKVIGTRAFTREQISSVVLPSKLETIEKSAFSFNNLTSVTLPVSVSSVGVSAFYNNPLDGVSASGETIHVSFDLNADGNSLRTTGCLINCPATLDVPGSINSIPLTHIDHTAFFEKDITSVSLASGITHIGAGSFSDNQLTSLVLPEGVIEIGSYAFGGNNLSSLTLPSSLVSILSNAFANNELSSLVIPQNVKVIRRGAFANNKLSSVTVPGNIEILGSGAFANNPGLSSVMISGGFPTRWSFSVNNDASTVTLTGCAVNCSPWRQPPFDSVPELWDLEVPAMINGMQVTHVGQSAFSGAFIQNLTTPDTLLSIGGGSFLNNEFLSDVQISNSVIEIGDGAFDDSTQLESIHIGASVTSIGRFAFRGHSASSIVIPDSVKTIGGGAFASSTLTEVKLGSGVESIGGGAFSGRVTEVVIPASVTRIDARAFSSGQPSVVMFLGDLPEIAAESFYWEREDVDIFAQNVFSILERVNWCQGADGWEEIDARYGNPETDGILFWGVRYPYPTARGVDCRDSDFDGISNYEDEDDDGDGIPDTNDAYPLIPIGSFTDTDGNGAPDDGLIEYFVREELAGPGLITMSAEATGCIAECPSELSIPYDFDGYEVRTIATGAFRNQGLKEVELPISIFTIKDYAFAYNELEKIIIPRFVSHIETYAFGYNNLTDIELGESVAYVGFYSFFNKYTEGTYIRTKSKRIHFKGDYPEHENMGITLADDKVATYCSDRAGWDQDLFLGSNGWNTPTPDCDEDGVEDSNDSSPNDPTNDSDGDGVANQDDAFPQNDSYTLDSDSDGMPDSWELLYGLDPNDASDASSDRDNDGYTALEEFLNGTVPFGSIDIDGNERYDALTDGLLILRSMFGLDGSSLTAGTAASDAVYSDSGELLSRINTLGDLADIDGNGDIDALTDGLLILRYLFGLEGETLVAGVVSDEATRTTEEIEAHLNMLMP